MNALLETHTFLSDCLLADPLLRLAHTVAWLDPLLWSDADEDAYEEGDELETALRVTRQTFPDIYAEAVEAVQAGATYNELDKLICHAFDAQGLPLDNLEFIGWGIPLPAYGVELEDLDCLREHP
ncbi:MAG: hypothetical protein L0312_16360, partial [Acidobacteria bacterium]|nr:hypothetical protein [Acidobacteriota bacterium]